MAEAAWKGLDALPSERREEWHAFLLPGLNEAARAALETKRNLHGWIETTEFCQKGVERGLEKGLLQGLEKGQALLVHLAERKLGRPLAEAERLTMRRRLIEQGPERLGDDVLDRDAASLAAWLASFERG